MTAEVLRRAAALMREWADAATEGPWVAASDNKRRDGIALVGIASMRGQGAKGCIAVLAGSGDAIKNRHANATHIASWHPAVALAVATLLEDAVWRYECDERAWDDEEARGNNPLWVPSINKAALAVARAYLGESA